MFEGAMKFIAIGLMSLTLAACDLENLVMGDYGDFEE